MSRRCSHCGNNGHNSRTCLDMKGGFKLFGVRLSADSPSPAAATESSSSSSTAMRKSFSMGNLCNYGSFEGGASPPSASALEQPDLGDTVEGYASDDLVHTSSNSRERKKGVPWTEEEHRTFLLGLQNLGKGDWRGISRNFVRSRTPTQVASHAQKYFLRRNNLNKRRRRSSLFDITPDTVSSLLGEPVLEENGCDEAADVCPELSLGQSIPYGSSRGIEASQFSGHAYPIGGFSVPIHRLSLGCVPMMVSETVKEAREVAGAKELEVSEMGEIVENGLLQPPMGVDVMESVPEVNDDTEIGLNQSDLQFSLIPMWPGQGFYGTTNQELWSSESKIVKPTPIIPRPPVKADDTMKLSELSINPTRPVMEPTPLSYKLLEEGSRHSAFHMTSSSSGNREIDGQGGLSNAISVP